MMTVPAESHMAQSPSTLRALQDMVLPFPEPTTPKVIAQTPAAAAALAQRQAAIQTSISAIPEKGRTSPRKF
jgi:hypothetical protein